MKTVMNFIWGRCHTSRIALSIARYMLGCLALIVAVPSSGDAHLTFSIGRRKCWSEIQKGGLYPTSRRASLSVSFEGASPPLGGLWGGRGGGKWDGWVCEIWRVYLEDQKNAGPGECAEWGFAGHCESG